MKVAKLEQKSQYLSHGLGALSLTYFYSYPHTREWTLGAAVGGTINSTEVLFALIFDALLLRSNIFWPSVVGSFLVFGGERDKSVQVTDANTKLCS